MKIYLSLLLVAFSITLSIAVPPQDDKEKKKKAESSCSSYNDFARKNKRVKKDTTSVSTTKSISK